MVEDIVIPYRIQESFIKEHPEWNFIYSTDLSQKGGLGMCWFMAGCLNSFPVPTLIKFCANIEYFSDSNLDWNIEKISEFLRLIPRDKPIIVPPRIGLGCARMTEKCFKTYSFLRGELNLMIHPYVKIDYTNIYR